jgi:hypothetical protein
MMAVPFLTNDVLYMRASRADVKKFIRCERSFYGSFQAAHFDERTTEILAELAFDKSITQ